MQVRQGFLLSMLLYIIGNEVLANFINTDKMIKVIQIEDHEIKMSCGTEAKFIVFQNISKRKLKKNIKFPLEKQKTQSSRQLAQLSGWTRYFRHRHTIKLYKHKMDSKVLKSNQCSLERSHALLIEVNSEFWSRSSTFLHKSKSLGLLVTKTYKNRTMKISLLNYSMLGYI